MRRVTRALWAMPLACGLAAGCDSLGGGDGGGDDRPSFAELAQEGEDLLAAYEGVAVTDPATLPVHGGATYQGVMGLDLAAVPNGPEDEFDTMGRLELRVDFDGVGDAVTGEVTEIVDLEGVEYTGQLDISRGVIDRDIDPETEWTFGADLEGTIEDEDGQDWRMEAEIDGHFLGAGHEAVGGVVDGEACTAELCTGMGGGFIAER
jgi:hypothetical protein